MESIKTQRIPNSAIRLMVEAAERMEREGREVVHLEIGRPDFNTPAHVVEACVEALRAGRHHYCPMPAFPNCAGRSCANLPMSTASNTTRRPV